LQEQKTQNFIKSTAILAITSIIVRFIGAIYKIPLFIILDRAGTGAFQVTYNVYNLALNIATAGVPVALSRMVSSAAAEGQSDLVKRYFKVAMPAFVAIGVAAMLIMLLLSKEIAALMNNTLAAPGIQVLAPSVLFMCIISVYRGYAQGFENMMPTAVSQTVEALSKAAFGIAIAYLLARAGYEVQYVSAGGILGVTIGLGLCVPILMWYKRKIDSSMIIEAKPQKLPSSMQILGKLMLVSIPITLGSSIYALVTVIDNSVAQGRLQNILMLSEIESSSQFGLLTYGTTLYNLPASLIVPVAISLVPAIASALAKGDGNEARGIMQTSVKLMNLFAMPACAGLMVLSGPIMIALFSQWDKLAANILSVLAVAAFFLCFQLVTTAILQANGNERLPLLSIPIGGALKIILSYILVGKPQIGILGSAIGSLACYIAICSLNLVFIKNKVAQSPNFINAFSKPLLCSTIMALVARVAYNIIYRLGSSFIGASRSAVIVFLAIAIIIAVTVYGLLIILTGTITKDELSLVTKSEKIAKILRVK